MKKLTFGTPEQIVPTKFCKKLAYKETDISYPTENISFHVTARGCVLEFPLKKQEQIYGFGLQLKSFNHKNHKLQLRANADPASDTGDSHAPVPFFVTTEGYGMYFDTARYAEVYCGFAKKRKRNGNAENKLIEDTKALYAKEEEEEDTVMSVTIPAAKGVDVYLFEGETILDVVAEYNRFSGGGPIVPEWGLGVMYRAYLKSTQEDLLKIADYLREKDLPCSILGLEPGWQTASYSCSYVWDTERFPDYKKMVQALREKNFHINLWEHAYVSQTSPLYDPLYELSGDYEVWKGLVPDFSVKEAKDCFAEYHRKNLVEAGIDGFKLDECDNGDFVDDWGFPNAAEFPGGMDGEQYHQMFGTLYMQTILHALGENQTLSEVRSAGALAASYPFVLYSDLYDHKDFIRGTVNSGFSGLLWTPELRDAGSEKELLRRLQSTVFSVQCLINAWYCEEMPWKPFDCEEKVRELLKIREQLVPMLKEAFDLYHETGIPPVRALVADYTSDAETYQIDDEYIFCGKLIVAPLTAESDTRKVYLPEGTWRDYFTKEPVESGWFEVTTEGIPVYEKVD